MPPHPEEFTGKKTLLRKLCQDASLDAVYLKRQANFSWLTCGGNNAVGIAMELGGAGLLISATGDHVVCNNIEAPRMADEERLEEQGYRIECYPWYQDREADTVHRLGGARIGADHTLPGTVDVAQRVAELRYSLTPWEVERYRTLGQLTARAVEQTALGVRSGETECAVVGRMAEHLWAQRIDYVATFCAADERISRYRHPIATEKKARQRLMLCVNSRKYGLIVSLTRFVQFGRIPAELERQYEANVAIDCTMMAHTLPGRPAREALERGIEAYRLYGYPEEYTRHHQGGAIGYMGRDYRTDFCTQAIVRENQAFAWNPSITGTKSEDTMIATGVGPLVLSPPVLFPALTQVVAGIAFRRPGIAEL